MYLEYNGSDCVYSSASEEHLSIQQKQERNTVYLVYNENLDTIKKVYLDLPCAVISAVALKHLIKIDMYVVQVARVTFA